MPPITHDGVPTRGVRPVALLLALAFLPGCTATPRPTPQESGTPSPSLALEDTIPTNTVDPRYREYFAEVKKRIEAAWVYPEQARRQGQTGHGVVGFVLSKDGSLRAVEILDSSGVGVLDRNIEYAIKFAAPFPRLPDYVETETLRVSVNFEYKLGSKATPRYRLQP